MKNSWVQYVTLGLCAVMLIVIIARGKKLEEYRSQLNNRIENLKDSVGYDIQSIRQYIDSQMADAEKIISSYELEPTGMNRDNHCLEAEVTVSVKEWHDDTEVELIAAVGEQNASIGMKGDGTGVFRGQISLPIVGNESIGLSAQITGGGMTRREELGGWSELSMLLPLQNGGGGWSGPEYQNGRMSAQCTIFIRGFDGRMLRVHEEAGMPASVQKPEFQIYKNGKLEQTLPAVAEFPEDNIRLAAGLEPEVRTESSEITYSVGNEWSIECEVGDVIAIRFVCQDEYGLGYDFLLHSWKAEGDASDRDSVVGNVSDYNNDESLRLFWP